MSLFECPAYISNLTSSICIFDIELTAPSTYFPLFLLLVMLFIFGVVIACNIEDEKEKKRREEEE